MISEKDFLKNDNWYYYDDEDTFVFRLTENAPEEVYKSYIEYLEDCMINEEIDDMDYEYLVQELEQFKKQKVNNLFDLQGGQNNGMQQ
jgi:hypothetical protein